ncbi:MAG: OmpA family protein [Alcaligenes pakistanensis]|nr:lipoprotein PlpD [Alcaligenes faecalis]
MKRNYLWAALLSSLALAGCGTLSQVDAEGQTDKPVFPEIDKTTFQTGSYPNIDNLRQVQAGVTRDQLYDLLGRPHFAEGFKVREWDYLFHFNTAQGIKTCQFKVLFDQDMLGRSFYWQPSDCASVLDPAPKKASIQPFSLSGDVAFAFGSAALTTAGLSTIRDIAGQLKQMSDVEQLTVSGHTDRIGNAASNQRLSQQRAQAVRNALSAQGIPAAVIQTQGFGQDRPLVNCDQQIRSDLIACLAPNRRVDIAVQGQR